MDELVITAARVKPEITDYYRPPPGFSKIDNIVAIDSVRRKRK